ncbi:MAG: hypothetical protein M3071_17595 [Actinomycetota bacterium]|nr:hypothetical protein [Actinomycetota bacterium]
MAEPPDYVVRNRAAWDEWVPEWAEGRSSRYEMVSLLHKSGFAVQERIEVRPPDGATTTYPLTLEWAQRWPCEEVWKAVKVA